MKNQPLVSIIMNCFNGERFLKAAIDSVVNQSYPNWEIIFWDNASTDKSGDIVNSYNDYRIKYYREDINVTLGEAREKAIRKINGDYVCILDVDDYFMPDKLKIQVEHMINHPDSVMSYSNLKFLHTNTNSEKFVQNRKKIYEGKIFRQLIKRNFIYLSTIMVNRKLADNELYFDKTFKFAEEYDLFLRLSLTGNISYIEKVTGVYRIHDNNFIKDKNNYIHTVEEKLKIYERFRNEIERQELDIYELEDNVYESYVMFLLRHRNNAEAKSIIKKVHRKNTRLYKMLYFITQYNLSFFYNTYFKIKNYSLLEN